MLNIVFAWRWLPEPAPKRTPEDGAEPRRRRPIRHQLLTVLRHPLEPAHSLIWIYTAGMMAFFAMNAVMALLLNARFGIDEGNIGWFYVAVGAVSVIMRGLVLGVMVRRFGEVRVLRMGALLLSFGMCAVAMATSPATFLLAVILVPTGTALLFPSTTSLVSRYAEPGEVGQTLGVQQAFGGMSRLLGPVWAGAVFQHLGQSVPFWLGGGLVLATALFALRLHPGEARKPRPENVEPEQADDVEATPGLK